MSQSNPSATDSFGFTGREYDSETGLYYLARDTTIRKRADSSLKIPQEPAQATSTFIDTQLIIHSYIPIETD